MSHLALVSLTFQCYHFKYNFKLRVRCIQELQPHQSKFYADKINFNYKITNQYWCRTDKQPLKHGKCI